MPAALDLLGESRPAAIAAHAASTSRRSTNRSAGLLVNPISSALAGQSFEFETLRNYGW